MRRRRRTRRVGLLCWLGLVSGCASGRTVLVADDSPIRIGPDVTGRVYVLTDGAWRLSAERLQLPEGWYCIPPRFVESGELP